MKKFPLSSLYLLIPLLAATFLLPGHAQAANDFGVGVANFIGWILSYVIAGLGNIMIVVINVVVSVAQYNGFITSDAVSVGWAIVRDVCNMFFIVILLIIAFATVLNVEKYSWKHLLPKLLIMAVLINFSKLICGVMIDFAQVVMLTFVNGFRDIGAGNFASLAGVQGLLKIRNENIGDVTFTGIVGTYILALFYVLASLVVMVVILFVLIMRIIMLWILVVLSPLTYLLKTTPATEKYAGKWWSYFTSNLVSGPLLAFFIWLSFAALQANSGPPPGFPQAQHESEVPAAGLAVAGTPEGLLKFVISMGMLIGGLMITKELGGAAGDFAGGGLKMLTSGAKKLTGYNAVADRVGAFNKKRDAARAEKIGAFGEKMYGRYNTVKDTGKAMVTGAREWALGGVPALSHPIKTTKKGFTAAIDKFRGKPAEREKRRKVRDARRTAYMDEKGKYSDDTGDYFEHKENGKIFYRREAKDEKGEVKKDAQGNTIYEYAKDHKKQNVEKMSAGHFRADIAWTGAMSPSRAKNNKAGLEKAMKNKDKLNDAGLSATQLLAILESASSSKDKKLAAGLLLGSKHDFKTHDQVKIVHKILHDKNNKMLSKQFNNDIDKKQAYLNYDMNTEEGITQFVKRLKQNKIEMQKAPAFKMKGVLAAYKKAYTDKEFVNFSHRVEGLGAEEHDNWKFAIREHLKDQSPPYDETTGKLDKVRKVAGKVTENLIDALMGISDVTKLKNTTEKVWNNMSMKEIGKQKPEFLNGNAEWEPALMNAYIEKRDEIIHNLTKKQINSLENDKDADRETVKGIMDIYASRPQGQNNNQNQGPRPNNQRPNIQQRRQQTRNTRNNNQTPPPPPPPQNNQNNQNTGGPQNPPPPPPVTP